MRIDPRRRARAFTLLEVVIVFLIIALMMFMVVGLIRSKANPKPPVPALPDTSQPVMIDRDGSRVTTPVPKEKPGFR